jgi:ribosomal protein S18 acetylase RimI-like enzyme
MPAADKHAPIEYGIYAAPDMPALARLLAEVFSQRDPLGVAAGLSSAELEAYVLLLCPKAAAEGLTVVARRTDTRELVGAMLTEDSASAVPDGMERISPKFAPIFDILDQLGTEYHANRTPHPGESLHLLLLGVAEPYTGQGVAQHLIAMCLEHGAHKGYRLAVTEATGKISQHIFRKQGFAERVRRSYLSHQFAGRAPFASVAEQGGPILMDKALSANGTVA